MWYRIPFMSPLLLALALFFISKTAETRRTPVPGQRRPTKAKKAIMPTTKVAQGEKPRFRRRMNPTTQLRKELAASVQVQSKNRKCICTTPKPKPCVCSCGTKVWFFVDVGGFSVLLLAAVAAMRVWFALRRRKQEIRESQRNAQQLELRKQQLTSGAVFTTK